MRKSIQIYIIGEWSAPVDKLCLKNFATWDDKTEDRLSSYTLNKQGYMAILDELSKDLTSIHLNSKVSLIDYSNDKTRLKMVDGQFYYKEFDFVIVTVPLGHLKAHAKHMFYPKLPERKLDAIDAFGRLKLRSLYFDV